MRVVRLIGVGTDRLQCEHVVRCGHVGRPSEPHRGRAASSPSTSRSGWERTHQQAAATSHDEGRDQGEGRDGAAEDHQPAAAAPPRCRGGSVDRVGIGDRPLGGVLLGDRPSGRLMLGGRPVDRLRHRCRSRARPFERLRDRDAFRDRGGDRCGGIDDGSQLSTLGGLQFGKPSLSRRIPRDVGIRSVRASSQALQLVRFLEARPTPAGHPCPDYPPGHNTGKGVPGLRTLGPDPVDFGCGFRRGPPGSRRGIFETLRVWGSGDACRARDASTLALGRC